MIKKIVSTGILALLGIGAISNSAQAQLIVTPYTSTESLDTPSELVDLLVDPTDDDDTVTIIGAPIYTGAALASGSFTGGTSSGVGLGINSGLILTSGLAADAVGPNNSDGTSTGNGTLGDADLNGLIPQATRDAASLEFSFTTTTGELSFNYVFASEEYNEFVNSSFNDVFAFFLNGENIALIPGTDIPVSINNVNGGNPLGVNASYSQFYNNNDPSNGTPAFNIEYDGFTDVFTASATGLTPNQEYTIKLAIADAGDSALDSAVFLEGGSFTGNPDPDPNTTTPESSSWISLLGIGFLASFAKFRKK